MFLHNLQPQFGRSTFLTYSPSVLKEKVIIKIQEDEQGLKDLQDKIIQVEGELGIEAKKSVLNSLIKKMKVDQNGLLEIAFGVVLGNTL